MQALGLIETRGLISAIEATDAMLKAADVTLFDKTYVGGGLVSIAVTGGVDAVKASVEAGVAAVNRINVSLLISSHVIPRPHEELNNLIKPIRLNKNLESQTVEKIKAKSMAVVTERATGNSVDKVSKSEKTVDEEKVNEEPVEEETIDKDKADKDKVEQKKTEKTTEKVKIKEEKTEENNGLDESVVKELPEVKENVLLDISLNEINKESIDRLVLENSLEKALEVLSSLKVVKLRNLAREYENMGIAGRMISNADKKMLLSEFEKYYKNK